MGLASITGSEAEETRITFKGSLQTEPWAGTCRLVSPIGENRTLIVEIGIDTSGQRGSSRNGLTTRASS